MAGTTQKQLSLCDACHSPTIKPWILSLLSPTTYNYLPLSFFLSTNGWATLIYTTFLRCSSLC
ncbi:hypothetical protein SRABI133_01303 [Peribacillus simplex]|uniref:Uncharacterized protein n=1 Tax=Peribacillus simplex TaxID=1478 RepID=A0A9W4KSW6_9BACI|nr:hypothetical protein SRABI133_01303 [Peribacillus simplex]